MEEEETRYVGLVDLTKCTNKEKEDLGWLAFAMYIGDKQCPICNRGWKCRQDVTDRGAICGYNGDAVCKEHWEEYKSTHKGA